MGSRWQPGRPTWDAETSETGLGSTKAMLVCPGVRGTYVQGKVRSDGGSGGGKTTRLGGRARLQLFFFRSTFRIGQNATDLNIFVLPLRILL